VVVKHRLHFFALLVALFTGLAASVLWWQSVRSQASLREQVLLQAEQRSLHLADAMAGQVDGLLSTVDLALQDLRRQWLRGGVGRFTAQARDVIGTLPAGLVSHVSVVNAAGYVVYNSLGMEAGTYVGDRDHFKAQQSGVDQLHIGVPVASRLTNRWLFIVSRPLLRDGRFDGTVHMLVSSDFMASKLAALQLSPQDVVTLVHQDGHFLARSRDNPGAMGKRLPADRPFLVNKTQTSGIFKVNGLVDGAPRSYGWQRSPLSGLVVVIGLADEAVLEPLAPAFRRNQHVAATLSLLLLAGGGLIIGLQLRLARNQAAVAASEALRMRLFDSSHVPTVVIDPTTRRFIDCNPAAVAIYGFQNRADVLLASPEAVSAPVQTNGRPSAELVDEYLAQVMASKSIVLEWRHQRPSGELWDAQVHLMRFDVDGQPLVQFTLQDITESKRMQAALQDSEARLKEAQRLARLGSWESDLLNDRLIWSDEVYRIFELDPANFAPTYMGFMQAVHPEDRAQVQAAYLASMQSRTPYDVVHRLLFPDGRCKYVRELCVIHFDADDRPVRSVGTVQDITEIRTAQAELQHLNDELELRVADRTRELATLNRELEAFAYSVSHDLRTPLRSIHGFASLLEEEGAEGLSAEGRSYLLRIQESAKRMGQFISDLLSMSHLSRAHLRQETVSLGDMAKSIASELDRSDPQRQVHWHIQEGLQVQADPGLMRAVLQNLLGNAWKYTGLVPEAHISLEQTRNERGMLEFCVRDNGAGFDMTYAQQLFQPFKRLHAHHEFEGSGVGLATVHRVIQRHGGSVRGEGAVGKGAAFYFTLPVQAVEPDTTTWGNL
jgi:PAS domain S-box-containing protein